MTIIFWDSSTPDDFINAKLLDWIEGVGDITTQYELDFVHRFGAAEKVRPFV
jgi:hypothetical protein